MTIFSVEDGVLLPGGDGLTDEQARALDLDRHVLVAAGAGSGLVTPDFGAAASGQGAVDANLEDLLGGGGGGGAKGGAKGTLGAAGEAGKCPRRDIRP